MQLFTAKNFAIFFALSATAFCVATIVLAVQKADLEDELQNALNELDAMTSTSTSSSATTESSVATGSSETTDSTISTGTTDSTTESTTTELPWPTLTVPEDLPTFPTLPPGMPDPEEIVYRLPEHIRPINYRLYWHPDLERKTCNGSVSIQIEVDLITNLIVLHAKDMEIEDVSILNMMGRLRIRVRSVYFRDEMFFIELDESLRRSTPYVVSMNFKCNVNGLTGMYMSSYLNEENKET